MSARQNRVLSLQDKLGTAMTVPDRQAHGLRDLEVADEAFVRVFEEHFQGTGVLEDQEKVRAATILRNSIKRGAERQLDAIVEMGRALLRAEAAFSKQEWNHLLEGGQRLLGIPKNTASMYRAVARDIDAGRLPRALCPESFSTAYILTTYEDWQLKAARERGLIRPNVTRKEVEQFKRLPPEEVPPLPAAQIAHSEGGPASPNFGKLHNEERQLAKRERRLLDELGQVQQRLETVREALRAGERNGSAS